MIYGDVCHLNTQMGEERKFALRRGARPKVSVQFSSVQFIDFKFLYIQIQRIDNLITTS